MSLEMVAVGVLVALAVAVALLPARRDPAAWGVPDGGRRRSGPARYLREVAAVAAVRSQRTQGARAGPGADVALALVHVAALLRCGALPARAWQTGLEPLAQVGGRGTSHRLVPDEDGVPELLEVLAAGCPPLPERIRHPTLLGWSGAQWSQVGQAARGAVAACRLSARLGAPLAQVLESVADGVAEASRADGARRTALAGPRSTARLLAVLPAVGLALGGMLGARPLEVLTSGGGGTVLALVGAVLMACGAWLTRRLVKAAQAAQAGVDEAVVLDLAAAALGAGASLPGALTALGYALEEDELAVVGRCLLLGAQWPTAWQAPGDAAWRRHRERLERCLRPGWENGAVVSGMLAQQAASLRAGRQAADQEAAGHLAVRLVVPLGLCYLPAFLCLGVAPVLISLGGSVLA